MDVLNESFKNNTFQKLLEMLDLKMLPTIIWNISYDFFNDFIFIDNKVEYLHNKVNYILQHLDLDTSEW